MIYGPEREIWSRNRKIGGIQNKSESFSGENWI